MEIDVTKVSPLIFLDLIPDKPPEINSDPIDITVIKEIPYDIEIPTSRGIETLRSLCTNNPENVLILDRLLAAYNPLNTEECDSSFFNREYSKILSTEELKRVLSEVLIRFDNNPQYYQQSDFDLLMRLLYSSLLFIYEKETKKLSIGPNLLQIATADDHFIDLLYPVSTTGEVSLENAAHTIPSVQYITELKLRWQAI